MNFLEEIQKYLDESHPGFKVVRQHDRTPHLYVANEYGLIVYSSYHNSPARIRAKSWIRNIEKVLSK